jgi:hypothetical protein
MDGRRVVNACEQCAGDILPGVLTGANGTTEVEVCDECNVFDSDLDAAFAVALKIPNADVRFWQDDRELRDEYEDEFPAGLDSEDWAEVGFVQRFYARPARADDCCLFGSYPEVYLNGYPIDWAHYRAVRNAFT